MIFVVLILTATLIFLFTDDKSKLRRHLRVDVISKELEKSQLQVRIPDLAKQMKDINIQLMDETLS